MSSNTVARHKKSRRFSSIVFLLLFLAVGLFLLTGNNKADAAPAIASSPCDADYYDSLSARAWLEAQREITQNQNLILKPDSVLEYTCFDMYLRELAQHASNMLSETSSFGSPLSSTSMDTALNDLVGTALINYINANYEAPGYDLLGGHPAAAGIDHVPTGITGGTYNCSIMGQVWQAAKCINFITNPAEDGFYTFQEYEADPDKRYLPVRCGPVNARFTNNIQAAFTSPVWIEDPIVTYTSEIDPANCSVLDPIPTGIQVVRPVITPMSYDEHICLPPGCRYDPVTSNCIDN